MIEVRVLAKKCDEIWLTLKQFLTTYLKDEKCMQYAVNPVCVRAQKSISPHNEWYIKNVLFCAHFISKLAHGTYCLCSITQLFRLLGIV